MHARAGSLAFILMFASNAGHGQCVSAEALASNPVEVARLADEQGKVAISLTQVSALLDIKAKIARAARVGFILGICKGDEANAGAMVRGSEGVVVFTTGMLNVLAEDKDMAVFVMGHEVAHLIANHTRRQAARERTARVEAAVDAVNQERESRLKGVAWLKARQIKDVISKGYGRELEQEADEIGLQVAIDAGYDPRGAVRAAKRMRAERGNWSDEYSDHPGWDQRIARMETIVDAHTQKAARVESTKAQQQANLVNSERADQLLQARQWRAANSFVAEWLRAIPQSGVAWYYHGRLLQRSEKTRAQALEAFEHAVTCDPENGDAWLALCLGLYESGHRWESANCARNIPGTAQADEFRSRTFGASLITGGHPGYPPANLWMGRDSAGKKSHHQRQGHPGGPRHAAKHRSAGMETTEVT